MRNLMVS